MYEYALYVHVCIHIVWKLHTLASHLCWHTSGGSACSAVMKRASVSAHGKDMCFHPPSSRIAASQGD